MNKVKCDRCGKEFEVLSYNAGPEICNDCLQAMGVLTIGIGDMANVACDNRIAILEAENANLKKMLDHNSKSNQKLNAKNMKLESDMAIALEGLQEITKLKSEVGRPYQTGGVAIHIAKETLLSLIDNKAKQALEGKK